MCKEEEEKPGPSNPWHKDFAGLIVHTCQGLSQSGHNCQFPSGLFSPFLIDQVHCGTVLTFLIQHLQREQTLTCSKVTELVKGDESGLQ